MTLLDEDQQSVGSNEEQVAPDVETRRRDSHDGNHSTAFVTQDSDLSSSENKLKIELGFLINVYNE